MRMIRSLRRDWETMKTLDRKEKCQLVWDYYKLPILALACLLLLGGLTAGIRLRTADTAMYAVFVNAGEGGKKEELDALLARSGVPMAGRTIDVAANYALRFDDPANSYADTVQVLAALFGIGDLDLFAADEAVFRAYADKGAFVDLSLFIEREDLAKFALFSEPGEGGREMVYGIILTAPSPLHDAGYYAGPAVIGVVANAVHLDEAVAFMKQLAAEK